MKNSNLENLLNSFSGKLISASGAKKETIYRKGILSENASEQKNERNKLRKRLESIFKTLKTLSLQSNKDNFNSLCDDFITFYFNVYLRNDFSVSSLISDNSRNENLKKLAEEVLPTIKKRYEEKTNKKEETKKGAKK
jgi:hypothetical protein